MQKKQLGANQYTFRDVAWCVFNMKIKELYEQNDISPITLIYKNMALLLFEFDSNFKRGTFFLLAALYCEANGISYFYDIKCYYDGYTTKAGLAKSFYDIDIEIIADILLSYIDYIKEIDLKDVINFVQIPIRICTESDFTALVNELTIADYFDDKKWNSFFTKKYNQYINSLT